MFPWQAWTKETVDVLIAAFAQCDFRCPVEGCEPNEVGHGGYDVPIGTWEGHPLRPAPRDKDGFMDGTGVIYGLGVRKPYEVRVRPEQMVTHWQTWHMRQGLCIILPCLAYGPHQCRDKACFGRRAALRHLTDASIHQLHFRPKGEGTLTSLGTERVSREMIKWSGVQGSSWLRTKRF